MSDFRDVENKYYRIKLGGLRQLERILGALYKVQVEVGFLSRGKINRRKVYFNILQVPHGTDERNPVKTFLKYGNKEAIEEKLVKKMKKEIESQVNKAQETGGDFPPFSGIKRVYREIAQDVKTEIQKSFELLPPIVKRPKLHKNLIPLVETGRLRQSINYRFTRYRKQQ